MSFHGKRAQLSVQANWAFEGLVQSSQEQKEKVQGIEWANGCTQPLTPTSLGCSRTGPDDWKPVPTSPVTWENVWLKDVSPGILAYAKGINSH